MFCHDVHFNEPWPSAEICRAAIKECHRRRSGDSRLIDAFALRGCRWRGVVRDSNTACYGRKALLYAASASVKTVAVQAYKTGMLGERTHTCTLDDAVQGRECMRQAASCETQHAPSMQGQPVLPVRTSLPASLLAWGSPSRLLFAVRRQGVETAPALRRPKKNAGRRVGLHSRGSRMG